MRSVLLILGAVALVLTLLVAGFFYMVTYGSSSSQAIAENVSVSNEWNELAADPPLRIRMQVQTIVLVVDRARVTADRASHIRVPDGRLIDPAVELKDTDGNWHKLRSGSFTVSDYDSNTNTHAAQTIRFTLDDDSLPVATRFVAVRLRSNEPFVASKVSWNVRYPK